jgi:mono/diheme cytochrome c family protein
MDVKRLLLVTTIALAVVAAASLVRAQGPGASSQKPAPVAPAGDVMKGKALYEQTYRCYACHGFDGQSGSPRLVPMARTEDGFIAYLRKPSSAAMPTFADAPNADLVNVYAYIRSLRPEAPAIENIPLLKDLLEQVKSKP